TSSAGFGALVQNWVQAGHATVHRARLSLRLGGEGAPPRDIVLADDLNLQLQQGHLAMRGVWAQNAAKPGRVLLDARFLPGSNWPSMGVLQVDNLRLEDLPGIQQGRTLPQRGVLGR